MSKGTTFLTVRLPVDKYEQFQKLVDKEERTVSQDVRLYITKRLEAEAKK